MIVLVWIPNYFGFLLLHDKIHTEAYKTIFLLKLPCHHSRQAKITLQNKYASLFRFQNCMRVLHTSDLKTLRLSMLITS